MIIHHIGFNAEGNRLFCCLLCVFWLRVISIAIERYSYQSVGMRFLPLNLESFAYRHLSVIPVLLQCKSNKNELKV